jgi:hypothetical protein
MSFGCGNYKCKPCYPFTYGCDYCGANFSLPVANGDEFVCDSCGYVTNSQDEENVFAESRAN